MHTRWAGFRVPGTGSQSPRCPAGSPRGPEAGNHSQGYSSIWRLRSFLSGDSGPGTWDLILRAIFYLACFTLLACAVRTGPAQVTVEPVVEWTAPGEVAGLRWTGRGWAGELLAEGAVVYWPTATPEAVPPIRWSDERGQALRAWAVTDGTVFLATPTELLTFSEGSTAPSTRTVWPEGVTVWDDGHRLWTGDTSDDVRVCTPGVDPAASVCWSFPPAAVRPDFGLPAWAWVPPWWCGLRVREDDVGPTRSAEVLCSRGVGPSSTAPEPAFGGTGVGSFAWKESFRIPGGTDATAVHVWIVPAGVFVSAGRWGWLWDLARGRLRWRLDLGASVTVRPVQTAGGILVVATRGLLLYALDARSGDRRWVLPLRAPVIRLLLLEEGPSAWVILTRMDEPPVIVDAATGRVLWQAQGWTAWDAALGDDGTVAWAGADGKIRVFRIHFQPTVRAGHR
jgi:hypothetical protein